MNLKRLVEISPALVAFLIFLGYLKLHVYYEHWGISIYHYLSISEVLLSFMNDLNVMGILFFVVAIQVVVGMSVIYALDSKLGPGIESPKLNTQESKGDPELIALERGQKKVEEFSGIIPFIDEQFTKYPGWSLVGIVLLTLIFTFLFLWTKSIVWLYFCLLALVQFVIYLLDTILGIKDSKILLQLSAVIVLTTTTYFLAVYDVNETECKPTYMVLQKLDGSVLKTTKTIVFLGKTEHYYLLYDRINSKSIVIPVEEIKETRQIFVQLK